MIRIRSAILLLLIWVEGILGLTLPGLSQGLRIPDLFQDETGQINARDFFRLSVLWKKQVPPGTQGDLNGDGIIDTRDLRLLVNGSHQPASVANATPKPDTESTPTPIDAAKTPTPVESGETATPTPGSGETTPTSTPTVSEEPPATPTVEPSATPTTVKSDETTPSPTAAPNATATPTPTNTPKGGMEATATPTNTAEAGASPTPGGETMPTPTMAPNPSITPSEIPTSPPAETTPSPTPESEELPTPTPELPDNTPTPTPTPTLDNGGGDLNPTPTPTGVAGNRDEDPSQPEFVRLWKLNRALNLFPNDAVRLPGDRGFAANELGYAVHTFNQDQEAKFISIDRFGRIFQRRLPISIDEFSRVALVDGLEVFGKFFETPIETRRFRYETFNLDEPLSEPFVVDHLGADAIAWAFGGSADGAAMAVLRFPNILTVHSIDQNGNLLNSSDIISSKPLPLKPAVFRVVLSDGLIMVLYSGNGSAQPLTLWLLDNQGNLVWEDPMQLSEGLFGQSFAADGAGNFYLVTRSTFGPRFYKLTENGTEQVRVLEVETINAMQWQDGLLWILEGSNNRMWGFTDEGLLHTGPVDLLPPNWNRPIQWLQLKRSGPDLGAFFADGETLNSLHYMQVEAGPTVTPTPLPSSGAATGATSVIDLGGDVTLEMVLIPKGTYQRGSPQGEIGQRGNEGPRHTVTLSQNFFMSRFEITNEQFRQFKPTHPNSKFITGTTQEEFAGDQLPATNVSWEEATLFCQWLSARSDFTFSLPTEAEWEYAARAGTTERRYWGQDTNNSAACQFANVADVQAQQLFGIASSFTCDDGFAGPAPVGSFEPNAFGLHDMLGNAWEWCGDWFGAYAAAAQVDPTGPESGFTRVIRGGSWRDTPNTIRAAFREGFTPSASFTGLGFRVVIREGGG